MGNTTTKNQTKAQKKNNIRLTTYRKKADLSINMRMHLRSLCLTSGSELMENKRKTEDRIHRDLFVYHSRVHNCDSIQIAADQKACLGLYGDVKFMFFFILILRIFFYIFILKKNILLSSSSNHV